MIPKSYLITFFAVLLFTVSIIYELYSVDRQLFHIHHIDRGTLSLSQQLSASIRKTNNVYHENIKNDVTNTNVELMVKVNNQTNKLEQLVVRLDNNLIISVNGQNYLAIFKAKADIQSKGDSFYHVKQKRQKQCIHQVISSIQINYQKQVNQQKNQNKQQQNNQNSKQIIINGKFDDCQQSEYRMSIKLKKNIQHTKQNNNNNDNNNQQLIIQVYNLVYGTSKIYDRIMLYCQHSSNNQYFGLGQQFSHFNLGHNRPYSLLVREKGVGRTDQPQTFILSYLYGAGGSYYNTYTPTPIWYSINTQNLHENNQYSKPFISYFLNSWSYNIWMNNQIYSWDDSIYIRVSASKSIKKMLSNIAEINGWTGPIPNWVNQGAIIGLQGGTTAVMNKYNQLKKSNTKMVGLWLQDWVNKRKSLGFSRLWWNWELDRNHYPNWTQMRNNLSKQNVNLLIYMNPMLTNVQKLKQNYSRNYYAQAKNKSYFVKINNNQLFQTSAFTDWKASLLDISQRNDEPKKFYQKILIDALNQTGAKGLMVDFGEAYPIENSNSNLDVSVKLHNSYPTAYHQVVRKALDSLPQPLNHEIYTFSRAGYLYTPKYTKSLWAGDQSMNFRKNSGLRTCLIAMLSSGLIGYSSTHCDIGGYSSYKLPFHNTSVRTDNLMTRWMQLAAFSPVFRTHQGNLPDQSLQVYSNDRISTEFAFYSHIYSALSEYRMREYYDKSDKSLKLPLIKPLFMYHQRNHEVYQIDDQFYLGECLLINPILTNDKTRKYYLPKGLWNALWTGNQVNGCDCYVESKGSLPEVFVKADCESKQKIIGKVKKIVDEFREKINYLQEVKVIESSSSQDNNDL